MRCSSCQQSIDWSKGYEIVGDFNYCRYCFSVMYFKCDRCYKVFGWSQISKMPFCSVCTVCKGIFLMEFSKRVARQSTNNLVKIRSDRELYIRRFAEAIIPNDGMSTTEFYDLMGRLTGYRKHVVYAVIKDDFASENRGKHNKIMRKSR